MIDFELKELLALNLREEKLWGSVEIIRKLGKMNNVFALHTLLDSGALSDKYPVNRKEAILSCIRNFGEINEKDGRQVLINLLGNIDDDIRYESIESLSKYSEPPPIKILQNLLSDSDWRIREKVLIEFARKDSEPLPINIIQNLLSDSDGSIREKALELLSKYPLDETLNLFILSCQDSFPEVRQSAVVMLGRVIHEISDHEIYKRVFKTIVNCLDDDSGNVRAEAAYSLGKIGDKEALEPLEKGLENEMYEWAESEMEGAINNIKNQKNL